MKVENINDIVNRMQTLLKFDRKHIRKIKLIILKQINKYCKEMKHQINDIVKFSSKNIKIIKFLKKPND